MTNSLRPEEGAQIRQRNNLFDLEAKAASRLLDQVRQYVGRSQFCQASDFEDLCTIHHSINDLFERVKRFSSSEAMPRVYGHAGVRAGSRNSGSNKGRTSVDSYGGHQLALPGSDYLEELDSAQREEDNTRAPLSDLLRTVPDVSMEELCRGVQVSKFPGGPRSPGKPPSRPASSPKGPPRRKINRQGTAPKAPSSPIVSPRSETSLSKPATAEGPSSELLVEVFMEWADGRAHPGQLQELRLEMQVVELPSRTPMRSLRITNQPGTLGTVTMEVHSLRRAELCMAVVKDSQVAGWDDAGDLSMLTPGGNSEVISDVASALRVPVSQLLSACATGASLEWEADAARTIVVQGKMQKAGKAVEYFPGNLQAVPESFGDPAAAGRGAAAAGALRSNEAIPVALQGSKHYQAAAGRGEGFSGPPSELQLNFFAKLSDGEAVLPPTPLGSRPVTAPHPPTTQPPQRKRSSFKPTPEEEASAVSRYVGRLLLRGSNTLRKRAEGLRSARPAPVVKGGLVRVL